MKRSELEHLIRAAGRIAGDREIVVIGSQAVLGQFPDAPPVLRRSMVGKKKSGRRKAGKAGFRIED